VVQSDAQIAGASQDGIGRFRLGPAPVAIGEFALADHDLMLLHPGHMGVAEHRHAIGPQGDRGFCRGRDILRRLARQAVHQIEIDGIHADLAQPVGGGGHLLEGLHPVHPRLHRRVEGLDAETCAGHARLARGIDEGVRQHARIQLDSHLRSRAQGKPVGHVTDQGQEMFG